MLIITLPSIGGIDLISLSSFFSCISKVNDFYIATLVHEARLGRTKPIPITWTIDGNNQKAQGTDSQLWSDSARGAGINANQYSLIIAWPSVEM